MRKEILLSGIGIMLVVTGLGSCSSSGVNIKKVNVKGYIEDKQRVDQNLEGNQGFVFGPAQEQAPGKSTRKVFVLEMTKEVPLTPDEEAALKDIEEPTSARIDVNVNQAEPSHSEVRKLPTYPGSNISIPSFDENDTSDYNAMAPAQDEMSKGPGVDYVVQESDTLQKISKKFFGSYSKWMKIYDANKDVIKNPDRIQPGITIHIPDVEAAIQSEEPNLK